MNLPGMIAGAALVGLGTAGLVTGVRSDEDYGPLAAWLRARFAPRNLDQEPGDGGFSEAPAVAVSTAPEEETFAFKGGKAYLGSSLKSRMIALIWLVLFIGITALLIAAFLTAGGHVVNGIFHKFISG